MIFLFASLFLVKRVFSLTSCIFIIIAILNHLVFSVFYFIFWISRYFSLKNLIILYSLAITIYLTNINASWYTTNISFLYTLDIPLYKDRILGDDLDVFAETKLRFVAFSSLPILSLLIPGFKKLIYENELLKNLYQHHFLYSSMVYLFLSEFFYIDRFLSLTWIFYPFYFLYLLHIVKFNKK